MTNMSSIKYSKVPINPTDIGWDLWNLLSEKKGYETGIFLFEKEKKRLGLEKCSLHCKKISPTQMGSYAHF